MLRTPRQIPCLRPRATGCRLQAPGRSADVEQSIWSRPCCMRKPSVAFVISLVCRDEPVSLPHLNQPHRKRCARLCVESTLDRFSLCCFSSGAIGATLRLVPTATVPSITYLNGTPWQQSEIGASPEHNPPESELLASSAFPWDNESTITCPDRISLGLKEKGEPH